MASERNYGLQHYNHKYQQATWSLQVAKFRNLFEPLLYNE